MKTFKQFINEIFNADELERLYGHESKTEHSGTINKTTENKGSKFQRILNIFKTKPNNTPKGSSVIGDHGFSVKEGCGHNDFHYLYNKHQITKGLQKNKLPGHIALSGPTSKHSGHMGEIFVTNMSHTSNEEAFGAKHIGVHYVPSKVVSGSTEKDVTQHPDAHHFALSWVAKTYPKAKHITGMRGIKYNADNLRNVFKTHYGDEDYNE